MVLALAATLTQLSHGGVAPAASVPARLDALGAVLAGGSAVPLLVARRWPLPAFVATVGVSAVLAALHYPLDLLVAPAYALYRVAAGRRSDAGPAGKAVVVVLGMLGVYLLSTAVAREGFPGVALIHTGLVAAGAWFAGERSRLRHEQLVELQERARRAEHDAERERQLAIAEERTRIARELHDSAGHAISVIAVRAGGARLRHTTDPAAALPALTAIENLARDTGEEIDQIVTSLRDGRAGDVEVDTPPGLGSIDTLIAHHSDAGLAVTFDTTGSPRPLGAVQDRAAYRILQEALTNAARHGAGRAAVHLDYDEDALTLTVTNPVTARTSRSTGGGHGIVGMHERATLLGGTLDTSRVNGRFRVHARLPYGARRT